MVVATHIFLEFSPRSLGKYFSNGWGKTTNKNMFLWEFDGYAHPPSFVFTCVYYQHGMIWDVTIWVSQILFLWDLYG